jgi:hypothetical protein
MRAFTTAAMLVLAVAGLSACNRSGTNNAAAKATNNSAAPASANTAAAAPAAPMDDPTYLTNFQSQCVEGNANLGGKAADHCSCVVEKAFRGRTGLYAFASTREGEQVIAQASAQCQSEQGTAGGAAQPGAEAEEEAAEGEQ